jgi:hypothetical protein
LDTSSNLRFFKYFWYCKPQALPSNGVIGSQLGDVHSDSPCGPDLHSGVVLDLHHSHSLFAEVPFAAAMFDFLCRYGNGQLFSMGYMTYPLSIDHFIQCLVSSPIICKVSSRVYCKNVSADTPHPRLQTKTLLTLADPQAAILDSRFWCPFFVSSLSSHRKCSISPQNRWGFVWEQYSDGTYCQRG